MAIESARRGKPESPGVSTRAVLISAVAFLLLLALSVGMLEAVYYWQVPVQRFPAPEKFPQPRVQSGERAERRRIEAEQAHRLTGYRWVDRSKDLIQIPIERAMQLLVAEGDKAYAPLAPSSALASPSAAAERLMTPQARPAANAAPAAPPSAGQQP